MMDFEDQEDEKKNLVYKVLICGDYCVGKTSLIKRYVDGVFSSGYRITLGVDFSVKTLEWDEKTTIDIQLWDIAGHERFGAMTRVYYKYAIAAIVCFDLTRPATFENVKRWQDDINDKVELPNGQPIPMILFANKCDLENYKLDEENLNKFCEENNFIQWRKTSAKDNTNINDSIKALVSEILKITKNIKIQTPKYDENSSGLNVIGENDGEGVDGKSSSGDGDENGFIKKCCKTQS